MVEEEGTVVEAASGRAVVAVLQTSACQSCRARQGCGQAVLADWGTADDQAAKNHFSLSAPPGLRAGDRVTLGIAEDTLSRAALWMYLWPLACAFLALLAAAGLALPEPVQLLAATVAGALAVALTRRRFRHAGRRWEPRILAVHPRPAELIAQSPPGAVKEA